MQRVEAISSISSKFKAYGAALIATFMWGSTSVVYALALETGIDAFVLACVIQFGIAITATAFALTQPVTLYAIARQLMPQKWWLVITAVVFLLRDLCFILALGMGAKLIVSVLDALWPLFFVAISSIVFFNRQEVSPRSALCLVIAMSGIALALIGQHGIKGAAVLGPQTFLAYSLAIAAALFAAIELNLMKFIRNRAGLAGDGYQTIALNAFARLPIVIIVPVALVLMGYHITGGVAVSQAWHYVGVLIAFWSLATICFTYAILNAPSGAVAPIAYFSPLINMCWLAYVFPDEEMNALIVTGGLLVICANLGTILPDIMACMRRSMPGAYATVMRYIAR